eukprot:gnl/Trimastix_PCT/1553.p1 GENE.gnl/Trimastix_PCT/1553~~gnl/Trimastix_PCT/1553.p1  ORF type:complete len:878 (-),score=280.43 gnl/Trimastix_PCT/1553:33-2603(-)
MSQAELEISFEEAVLRDPYNLKNWILYLETKREAPYAVRQMMFERALQNLPGSYKLWRLYLTEARQQLANVPLIDRRFAQVNYLHERAFAYLHKMPRLWIEYAQFLISQRKVTLVRTTLDRALQSLPLTQHQHIWRVYTKFVRMPHVPPVTALRVYRRYVKLEPDHAEELIEYLLDAGAYNEAATRLIEFINNDRHQSLKGKSKHQMWLELCDVLSEHAEEIQQVNAEAVIRGGIVKFRDEVGRLWNALAGYFIRLGQFEKARDIFEEGIASVSTVRDFSQIFDAYAQCQDSLLSNLLEQLALADKEPNAESDEVTEIDMRMARMERIINRRPLLLSSVMLRQNPHNVSEWHKRVQLYEGQPEMIVKTYTDACATVDPAKATGKPHTLWVSFAKYYEQEGDLETCRTIFERATKCPFRSVDDLATVWCEWGELELRQYHHARALDVLKQAITSSSPQKGKKGGRVQNRLWKSTKLWAFYCDLEENFGTLTTLRIAYDTALDYKIATVQMVINYAQLLRERRYFEDSFKVYERGIALFEYPHVYDIWLLYLTQFQERYGGSKLERLRDLYELAIAKCPGAFARTLYLLYAKLEEDHGLIRHAMDIYARATDAVDEAQRLEMYEIYISRAASFYGVTKTRDIYEAAIAKLPDKPARDLCLKYAALEQKLGEIDRSRAIYVHCSRMCDPTADPAFWQRWNEFEIRHGNPDTFREMLRIRRTVQAQFSKVNFVAQNLLAVSDRTPEEVAEAALMVSENVESKKRGKRKMRPLDIGELPEMRNPTDTSEGVRLGPTDPLATADARPPAPVEAADDKDSDAPMDIDEASSEAPAAAKKPPVVESGPRPVAADLLNAEEIDIG